MRRLSARHPDNRSGFICGVFTAVPGRALRTERFARSPVTISRRLLGQPFLRSLGLFAWRPPSASSWQAPVMGPGGAPAQPECQVTSVARGRRTVAGLSPIRPGLSARRISTAPPSACSISQRPAETPLGEQSMRTMVLDCGGSMETIVLVHEKAQLPLGWKTQRELPACLFL